MGDRMVSAITRHVIAAMEAGVVWWAFGLTLGQFLAVWMVMLAIDMPYWLLRKQERTR